MKLFEHFEAFLRKIRTPSKDTEEAEYVAEMVKYLDETSSHEWAPYVLPPLLFRLLFRIIDLLKSLLFVLSVCVGMMIVLLMTAGM